MNIYENDKSGLTFFWDTNYQKIRNMAIDGLTYFRYQTKTLFPSLSSYSYFYGIIDYIKGKTGTRTWNPTEAINYQQGIYNNPDYVRYVRNVMIDDGGNGLKSLHTIANEVLQKHIDPNKPFPEEKEYEPITATSTDPLMDSVINSQDEMNRAIKEAVDRVSAEVKSGFVMTLKTIVPYVVGAVVFFGGIQYLKMRKK